MDTNEDDIRKYALARVRASISKEEILKQAEAVCRSLEFEGQGNPQRVLRYLVAEGLEGRVPTAKDVAKKVLGKKHFGSDDSQVRREMIKVRSRLNDYYAQEVHRYEIRLEIPARQYTVFWRHSPNTLLGTTEYSGRIIRAAQLPSEDEKKASETCRVFWPHLATVFPVYCDDRFTTELSNGTITLPVMVKLFFNSIGNHHLFITSPDRSEIRIYPINVWLAEWARLRRSEASDDFTSLSTLVSRNGDEAEIENKAFISLPPKLLKLLTIPHDPFPISLSFHVSGYLHFSVPKPPPRPINRCNLHRLFYQPRERDRLFYLVLVETEKEEAFKAALNGKEPFNIKSYGYIVASGHGHPPDDLVESMLKKYEAVMIRQLSG